MYLYKWNKMSVLFTYFLYSWGLRESRQGETSNNENIRRMIRNLLIGPLMAGGMEVMEQEPLSLFPLPPSFVKCYFSCIHYSPFTTCAVYTLTLLTTYTHIYIYIYVLYSYSINIIFKGQSKKICFLLFFTKRLILVPIVMSRNN
jgi:hypothetical protein